MTHEQLDALQEWIEAIIICMEPHVTNQEIIRRIELRDDVIQAFKKD